MCTGTAKILRVLLHWDDPDCLNHVLPHWDDPDCLNSLCLQQISEVEVRKLQLSQQSDELVGGTRQRQVPELLPFLELGSPIKYLQSL